MTSTVLAPPPVSLLGASRAILSAITIVVVGVGLLGTSVVVRAENEGFATTTIGLLGSANYAGFLIGALLGPRLVARVGHIRVYSALASICGAATLLFPAIVHPIVWMAIRLVLGLSMAGIYVVVESWLNSVATNESRGRLLAIYLVLSNLAIGAGQGLFVLTDADAYTPFLLASAICSLSIIPLALSVVPAPIHDTARISPPIRAVFRAAPMAPLTAMMSGFGIGVIVSLGALYASQTGMPDARIGLFVALASIGGVVLQVPIGIWSDRYPRRQVILIVSVIASLIAAVGSLLADNTVGIYATIALYAALSYPLYSVANSHLNDVIEPELRTAAGGVLILAFGIGSVLGPLVGSMLMRWQSRGFWVALAGSNFVIMPYLVYRIATRPAIPQLVRNVALNVEISAAPSILSDTDSDTR